jgi:uncharacterized protein
MKFIHTLFLCFLAFRLLAYEAVPPLTTHVNDYANLIPDALQSQLEQQLREHEDSTSNQIVVLTIHSLDGESVEEAALEIFNTWGLGQRGKDNGVLLLISLNDRKMRIEVGYGLEGTLTDAHCGRIIRDEITPLFKKGAYAEGISAGVTAIRGAIYGTYSADGPGLAESFTEYSGIGFPDNLIVGSFVMFVLLVFTVLAILTEGSTSRSLFFFMLIFYLSFPFVIFGSVAGMFILSAYIGAYVMAKIWFMTESGKEWMKKLKVKKGWNSFTASGSFSSTTRRSSSGWSSSRSSFSGGGGRSGGGGSSGSW